MATEQSQKTLFLIDGSSFLYRAYYAIKPMHTIEGTPVQAVFGFCRMIKKILNTFSPTHIAVVWDSPGPTERHEMYQEYKSTRQSMPTDLQHQKALITEFIDLIHMRQLAMPGIEADDLMFSLATDARKQDYTVVLITSDKDMGQLLDDQHIRIFDPFKDNFIDKTALESKYGFPLSKLAFYFALIGDTSDNIPGVTGIGPKGATELVKEFDSLKTLYDNLERVPKERTRELLNASRQQAFMSEELFKLRYHQVALTPKESVFDAKNWAQARPFFEKLQFASLLKELSTKEKSITEFARTYGYEFITVTTVDQLKELCQEIKKSEHCALDTETDGKLPTQARLIGISLCTRKGVSYYIPIDHCDAQGKRLTDQLERITIDHHLKPLLEDETIKKYLHHAKFDQHILANESIQLRGIVFDTIIAGSLVLPDSQRLGLKYISQSLLNETMITFSEVAGGYPNFAYVSLERATDYAAADAHQTNALVPLLTQKLQEHHQLILFTQIEMPLMEVLYVMEREGIILDTNLLKIIDEQASKKLERVRQEIIDFVGEQYATINLNSPKQLGELLFEYLKLPPVKKTSQKTGYSTDQSVLEELAEQHPVPRLIIQYRELAKLKSTYIDALPTYINPHTGRIHTTFNQTATATGRLASNDPNLQNIPVSTATDIPLRAAFKPQQGHLFLSADYSQIELRVLAYLSQDEQLVNAFLQGKDIHTATAAQLFDVDPEKVTTEQRQLAKRINFSILYGLTPYGLAKDLHISHAEAKTYIEKYFAQYPGVVVWMERTIEFAKEHGYVETLWGWRRFIPGIHEKNKTLFELAKRIAINTVAQGTAAELMKLGMISLYREIKSNSLKSRMLLQIHDELLLSVPHEEIEYVQQLVTRLLQEVVTWNVPLVVSTRKGTNWQEVSK